MDSVKHQQWKLFGPLRRGVRLLDRISRVMAPPVEDGGESPNAYARGPIVFGMWAFLIVLGIFGVWAELSAPLNSAAVAQGQVILDSNRKTIKHLEGGIVKEILVREGGHVKQGEVLVKLDETASKARLDLLKGQYITNRAAEARLLAERDNKLELSFPDELLQQENDNPIVKDNLDSQRRLFESRRKNIDGEGAVLQQKIEQQKREIQGLEAQAASAEQQMKLLQQEISVVRKLLAEGNAMRPRLLALERQSSDLEGRRGEHLAMVSRAQQAIAEAEIQMINTRNKFMNDVVSELKDTQAQIGDIQERMRASQDTMDRINIVAPIAGTITALKVHTKGGVIAPGEALMDIVPFNDELIIEAKVQVQDIDVVHADLPARVRLTAYKTRQVPNIEGVVKNISADRFTDERTGVPYYLARVSIPHSELEALPDVKLYPGMPADVLIVTGERTMLAFLFSPIRESFSKAFREQ